MDRGPPHRRKCGREFGYTKAITVRGLGHGHFFMGKATFLELLSVQKEENAKAWQDTQIFRKKTHTLTSNNAIKQKNPKTSYPEE